MFAPGALAGEPDLVSCILSGGARGECVAITVTGVPSDHGMGPWCPSTIAEGPEAGGIWLDDGAVYDVDGAFVAGLAAFYSDPTWRLYDPETGKVRVTRTKEACEAAARPDVDPAYRNHCVQCESGFVDPAATVRTYVLPLTPVMAARPGRVGRDGTGVALNGVRLDRPAPVDAILGAHTLAPFDDCGGHVNPHEGYHYHAAMECSAQARSGTGHAPVVGLALDGHRIHARLDAVGAEAVGLDSCRGHGGPDRYHYHAAHPGANAILPCFSGQMGCVASGTGERVVCDASATAGDARRRPGPGGRGPDFTAAAALLGVDPARLRAAMDAAGGPRADLAAVARTLGVSEAALRDALPPPPGRR